MIIYLTKVDNWVHNAVMEANGHDFFGLAADAVARSDRRKSRLMLANNRLVGIFLSSPRFSTARSGFSMRFPL